MMCARWNDAPMNTEQGGVLVEEKKGRQRIDYSEAEQMLRAGKTQQEVADHFGVTQPAVNRAIWRGKIKDIAYDRTTTDESAIPWHPVRPEHRSRYLVRMLRAAARRDRGEQSAPVLEAQLDNFLKQVDELDFVIHYDPDTDDGFFRVARRAGVDKGLIRDPYLDDNGLPIRDPKGVKRPNGGNGPTLSEHIIGQLSPGAQSAVRGASEQVSKRRRRGQPNG